MTLRWRKAEELAVKAVMVVSLSLVLVPLAGIVAVVVVKGARALDLAMIFQTPRGGYYLGKEGGIANAVVGSFYLSVGASALSIALALPIAVALQKEYVGRRLSDLSRMSLDVLWGTPSIVYGAIGFVIMQYYGIRASLLGGILVLTLVMLPIMIRAMEQVIAMVPVELKETAYSLGTTRLETTLSVVLRQAMPGIVTGVLLAFGRGFGDAASILFTAGYSDYLPRSIMDPVASLPLAVFFQIGTPIPEVQERAYASALLLLAIVLLVNVGSRLLSARFSRNILK